MNMRHSFGAMDVVVVAAVLFCAAFVVAWLASPRFRAWIERPKFGFQAALEEYDRPRRGRTLR